MDNERYLWLVMRNLTGEISPEEKQELENLLRVSSFENEKHKLYKKFWSQEVFYNDSQDTTEALEKVLCKINAEELKEEGKEDKVFFLYRFKKFAVAAVILVAIGLGLFTYQTMVNQKEPAVAMVEKYNGNGTRSMVTLSDGTRVWLNSDSKIRYPEVFKGQTRNVHLTGEAYFKVAHNAEKPFFIHLNEAQIKVLGTSFNVKAYSDEKQIQTSVMTGKVAFITQNENLTAKSDTVFLTRNKKVTYSKESGEIKTEITDTNEDKEWINGKLIFKAESLEAISKHLERNFGKKVIFKNDELRKQKYTGTFDDSSLDEILYFLSLSKTFKYTTTDSTLTIY